MDFKQTKYINWLNDPKLIDMDSMGAKAKNLSRLMQAGFLVPDAFCLKQDAFLDFISSFKKSDSQKNNDLKQQIISAEINSEIRAVVLVAYQFLKQKYGNAISVAVRSSAADEDSAQASYAGQYDSILNVNTEDELLLAIKQCWGSYFSPQVQAYRSKISQKDDSAAMSVIVQIMVRAEVSGVVFTVNPQDPLDNCLVLEIVKGLPDKLVAGEESGDHLCVNKRSLKVVAINNQSNNLSLSDLDTLKNINIQELFKLAIKIEKHMNSAQDIEWAYEKGKFWILQSRPITYNINKRQIWTRANAGEILPDVLTPLTWSVFKPILQLAGYFMSKSMLTLHWKWKHPQQQFPDSPKLFNGKAYMELTTVYAGFGSFPGVNPEILQKMLGFEYNILSKSEIPQRFLRYHFMDIYRGLRYWLEVLNITDSISKQAKRFTKKKKISNTNNNAHDVLKQIKALFSQAAVVLGAHIQCTAITFSAFGLIDALVKKYVDAKTKQLFESALISDFNTISTVQQNIMIWELAQKIKNSKKIGQAVVKKESMHEILNYLNNSARSSESSEILKLWNEFMLKFGERSSQEFELAIAHWNENADFILQRIRDIIISDSENPRVKLKEQKIVCDRVISQMQECLNSKANFFEKLFFKRVLQFYKKGIPLRENLKYAVVTKFNTLRKLFLELGLILKEQAQLSNEDDVFFLKYEQIKSALIESDKGEVDLKEIVLAAKKQHKENQLKTHPGIFIQADEKIIPLGHNLNKEVKVLTGIGCSHGLFTGPAYVLDSVLDNIKIVSGHILVAPSIDPGLTPLFINASGLVTEVGGMLSHGATVAREYGLPAVVGVPGATKRIKTGQIITVDGVTGKVYLNDATGVKNK